jgi:hypothetical protein
MWQETWMRKKSKTNSPLHVPAFFTNSFTEHNRTMLYPCRKPTQNKVKPPLHASLIPAELHRAAKKLPSCLRKTKRTREEHSNDLHTDNKGRNTTILKDTHTHHYSHEDNKDTHTTERLNAQKSLYSTTTHKATKKTSTTTTNQEKV